MILLALDPGSEETAWALYDASAARLLSFGKAPNVEVLDLVRELPCSTLEPSHLAIEMIASYGMAVGATVFDTCVWIGRFIEIWRGTHDVSLERVFRVFRREVKLHLCGQARAKDPNVRQALIDKFGPGKERAIGTKKQPGPLYGVSADVWSALAVAVTATALNGGRSQNAATSAGSG